MEDESTGGLGIINWLARLTRKVTSGKIVSMYYGENPPPAVADSIRDARSVWIILLSDSRFDIDGMFANCAKERTRLLFSNPQQAKNHVPLSAAQQPG